MLGTTTNASRTARQQQVAIETTSRGNAHVAALIGECQTRRDRTAEVVTGSRRHRQHESLETLNYQHNGSSDAIESNTVNE